LQLARSGFTAGAIDFDVMLSPHNERVRSDTSAGRMPAYAPYEDYADRVGDIKLAVEQLQALARTAR
jgi:hypothetical protein